MNNINVLYITYDGLTDPLGRSQILPYLTHLSLLNNKIHILSCEKPERYQAGKNKILEITNHFNIDWHPVFYHKKPPVISTIIDIINLKKEAAKIVNSHNIKIVHTRSYIASVAGLKLKQKYDVKFIFDMRGFFADERVEGNVWNLKNPVYKLIYKYFKKKEYCFFTKSDKIVSLTENGKKEILKMNLKNVNESKIEIIPCCADFSHFKIPEKKTRLNARTELNIKTGDLVIGYLGSLGTWYLVKEMLQLFKHINKIVPESKFLLISNDSFEPYSRYLEKLNINNKNLISINTDRDKLPFYLSTIDIGVSFIKPCFSKKASSPTKIAEMLAMGIPVIINKGVGDLDSLFTNNLFGLNIKLESNNPFDISVETIHKLKNTKPEIIRQNAQIIFDLEKIGVSRYNNIYKSF